MSAQAEVGDRRQLCGKVQRKIKALFQKQDGMKAVHHEHCIGEAITLNAVEKKLPWPLPEMYCLTFVSLIFTVPRYWIKFQIHIYWKHLTELVWNMSRIMTFITVNVRDS